MHIYISLAKWSGKGNGNGDEYAHADADADAGTTGEAVQRSLDDEEWRQAGSTPVVPRT